VLVALWMVAAAALPIRTGQTRGRGALV
jgi:hypothetical protein